MVLRQRAFRSPDGEKAWASGALAAADGASWALDFNIDAHARTSYGVAMGTVTVQ
jgi:hypothetical protein